MHHINWMSASAFPASSAGYNVNVPANRRHIWGRSDRQVLHPPDRYVMCLFLLVLWNKPSGVSGQWRFWEQSWGSYLCAGHQPNWGNWRRFKLHTQKVLSATVLFYRVEYNFYIALFAHEVVICSFFNETCLIFSITQLINFDII